MGSVIGQIGPRKQEEVVVSVFIVVDVHPVERLAVQLWEERIVAVLVAVQTFFAFLLKLRVLGIYYHIHEDEEYAGCGQKPEDPQGEEDSVLERL